MYRIRAGADSPRWRTAHGGLGCRANGNRGHDMLPQLLLGSLLVVATSAVHSAVTVLVLGVLRVIRPEHWVMRTHLGRASLVAGTVLLVFLAALLFWRRFSPGLAWAA